MTSKPVDLARYKRNLGHFLSQTQSLQTQFELLDTGQRFALLEVEKVLYQLQDTLNRPAQVVVSPRNSSIMIPPPVQTGFFELPTSDDGGNGNNGNNGGNGGQKKQYVSLPIHSLTNSEDSNVNTSSDQPVTTGNLAKSLPNALQASPRMTTSRPNPLAKSAHAVSRQSFARENTVEDDLTNHLLPLPSASGAIDIPNSNSSRRLVRLKSFPEPSTRVTQLSKSLGEQCNSLSDRDSGSSSRVKKLSGRFNPFKRSSKKAEENELDESDNFSKPPPPTSPRPDRIDHVSSVEREKERKTRRLSSRDSRLLKEILKREERERELEPEQQERNRAIERTKKEESRSTKRMEIRAIEQLTEAVNQLNTHLVT